MADDNRNDDATDETTDERDAEIVSLKAALKKANSDAAKHRHDNREMRERLDAIDATEKEKADATLPEMDKLRRQLGERDKTLVERDKSLESTRADLGRLRLQLAWEREAAGKIAKPERAFALANLDGVETDPETGAVTGMGQAVKSLLEDFPELAVRGAGAGAGTPPVNGRAGGGTPPHRGMGGGGGGGDVESRAREQLIQTGNYQRY